jgi:hypothetical protein
MYNNSNPHTKNEMPNYYRHDLELHTTHSTHLSWSAVELEDSSNWMHGFRVQGFFFTGLRFRVFIKLGFRVSLVV